MELLDVSRLNEMRSRILKGEEFTAEEYRDIIRSYRQLRGTIDMTSTEAKSTAAKKTAASRLPLADFLSTLKVSAK
jgi:hypothetical protein